MIKMTLFAAASFKLSKCSNIIGFVQFRQTNMDLPVLVTILLYGLSDGYHGIHVHEKSISSLTDLNLGSCCDMLGGHFNIAPTWNENNKTGTPHGSWEENTIRHTGDLCNNIYSKNEVASFTYSDNLISIINGHPANIVGRSIVVHDKKDDCGFGGDAESSITGNAGSRTACADIEYIIV